MKNILFALAFLVSGAVVAESESDFWLGFDVDPSRPAIDHSAWAEILSSRSNNNPHADWRHRFNPADFSKKEKKALKKYIESMQEIDPRYYSYDDQLAYWLNLYNALTVSFMVDAKDFNDVRHHHDKPLLEIAGKRFSQRYIANTILYPVWNDLSLHFLLSCAAVDCPPLPERAFSAGSAHPLSKPAMDAYINGPQGWRLEGGTLYLPRAMEHFSTYFDSQAAMIKRLAFAVPQDKALKLLGHSGPVVYSDHTALASATAP